MSNSQTRYRVQTWVRRHVGDLERFGNPLSHLALISIESNIGARLTARQVAQIAAAGAELRRVATELRALPPIPDEACQALLAATLDDHAELGRQVEAIAAKAAFDADDVRCYREASDRALASLERLAAQITRAQP